MTNKNSTSVVIGTKQFDISGYESTEYLQKIASFVNSMYSDYMKIDGFKHQSLDMQNILLELNLADEYFKAKDQINFMEEDLQTKEKELYDLKHELIATQIKLDNAEKALKDAQKDVHEQEKEIVRLKTELSKVSK